jgi:hypothetical protein
MGPVTDPTFPDGSRDPSDGFGADTSTVEAGLRTRRLTNLSSQCGQYAGGSLVGSVTL